MWFVLLDGVGVLCVSTSPRAGRVALRGRAAEKGPYPVLGRRTDGVAARKPPNRAAGRGSKKLRDEQPNRRLRSQFACRNRFVRPRELQGQSFSSCASGVEKFSVRAAYTVTKAPERVPDT